MAAATADDELLSDALSRVVGAFVSIPSGVVVSSEKEALSALESAVALFGALWRLGKLGEAAPKLAATAEKIAGDLPSFFASGNDDDDDNDEAKSKTVFAFHEATAAAYLASGEPKKAETSLEALLALRRRNTKKKGTAKTSPVLSLVAVADALASRLSAAARKEAAAPSSSSEYSRLLEEAAEGCLEFAREAAAGGGGEGEGEGEGDEGKKVKTTAAAAGALVAAFDLAVDAETAGHAGSPKALGLWREAAAALASLPSSSSATGDAAVAAAAAAAAAASEARAFLRWRDAFDGTRFISSNDSSSPPEKQPPPGPLDAATRASLREGLRARWSRVTAAAAASSSSSKSLARSSSSSSSSAPSSSSSLSALPPAAVLSALARLALSERDADDARRASRAALKSAKAAGLPAGSEAALSARLAAARAAALSSSAASLPFSASSSSLASAIDPEELRAIRAAAPEEALSRPFSAAREAAVLLLVASSSGNDGGDGDSLASLAGSVVGRPEHWLLAAVGRLRLLAGSSAEAAEAFREAAEEASSGLGAATDAEAAEHWLELGKALSSSSTSTSTSSTSSSSSSPQPPPPTCRRSSSLAQGRRRPGPGAGPCLRRARGLLPGRARGRGSGPGLLPPQPRPRPVGRKGR